MQLSSFRSKLVLRKPQAYARTQAEKADSIYLPYLSFPSHPKTTFPFCTRRSPFIEYCNDPEVESEDFRISDLPNAGLRRATQNHRHIRKGLSATGRDLAIISEAQIRASVGIITG